MQKDNKTNHNKATYESLGLSKEKLQKHIDALPPNALNDFLSSLLGQNVTSAKVTGIREEIDEGPRELFDAFCATTDGEKIHVKLLMK